MWRQWAIDIGCHIQYQDKWYEKFWQIFIILQNSLDYFSVSAWNDQGYGTFSLHFIKNKEQQEVDFLIAQEGAPFILVEAKVSDTEPSSALKKFQNALKKPAVQLVEESEGYRMLPNGDQYILVAPAYQWLSRLP